VTDKIQRLHEACHHSHSGTINILKVWLTKSKGPMRPVITHQGLINPLARRLGLVISTFGLAEIISCMPNGLVKIYIGYWQTCQYSRIYLYSYMLFNQQQCFIYSTASFLSKLRAKKVEKLHILVIKQLQQMTAYRKFRKWNSGTGNDYFWFCR
jgi:hypothetical protein